MKFLRRIFFLLLVALATVGLVSCEKDPVDNGNGDGTEDVLKYTVSFENTDLDSVKVEDGGKITEPSEPTKDGYIFQGWFADSNFETEFDFNKEITGNVKVYAHYYITLAKALEIGGKLNHNEVSEDKYYISGEIKSIDNSEYGNMLITDGETDFYVYGVFSHDGKNKYETLDPRPVVGDTVFLYTPLKKFNDDVEANNSWLVKMEQGELPEFDIDDYTEYTMAQAREKNAGEKVIIEGVVAQLTRAGGNRLNGLFLTDETGTIYIHDGNIASSVSIGDSITVAGTRVDFILETELGFAVKHGYKGAIQLDNAVLVDKGEKNQTIDLSWVEETTIKDLVDFDPKEGNITGNIYKVNAFINKAPGTGFTNYYFNDLDNYTGSYTYSMNNGSDFSWLDQYHGELRTVYIAVINAKSTVSNVIYRFVPIQIGDVVEYDTDFNPEFAVKFHGVDQFLERYMVSPDLEVITSVSNELLGIENIGLTYTSNNEDIAYFEEVDGKLIFKTNEPGTVKITITGVDGENNFSEDVYVEVIEIPEYTAITVNEAIETDRGEEVTVEGIVGASLVNKVGFYLIDESGIIAVELPQEQMAGVQLGNKVVVKGTRTNVRHELDEDDNVVVMGQTAITDAVVFVNFYGDHEYSTASFKTGKTLGDFVELDRTKDFSTEVYTFEATIFYEETPFFTRYQLQDETGAFMNIYSSSGSQLRFLQPVQNQKVIVEFTVVNWNAKFWTGSVLSVTVNGQKLINDSNFR